jgi:diguanylate cyclase (GGDEF)-like protein
MDGRPGARRPRRRRRATRFVGSHTDITDRKALEAQALRDPVTGLANRALFLDRLSRAVEREKQRGADALAVLVLDLDRFQLVNAALGRAAGDRLLREVAFRLCAAVRPEDTVARVGDDEFVVLVEEVEDEGHAARVAARLQDEIRKPLELEGQELFPSASVGIATSLRGYPGAERLVLDAVAAVVRAKGRSREQVEMFDPRRQEPAAARLRLETDLRKALERGEVCVSYQPIVDLEEDRLAGFEALARWSHPSRGPVPPQEFIALAEETGLIVPLGYAVLREVCRQLADWRARFGADAVPPVSVNLSARQLAAPGVVDAVRGILEAAGVPGPLLHLEVTESAVLEDAQAARERLAELEALGIGISLDDFGTGYSSLSLLHELPVKALKIDRSFVSGLGQRRAETVRAIVALARSLELDVVAEGVETTEERATVEALGCRYAQGFLFGSARAAVQAGALIDAHRREPRAC